ncbi:MAG TPA: signal peptide peptidase SppA, partial [Chitinophagaceae bacterium]
GLNIEYFFLKDALDRLQIEPQIFYAGKYKSATEPFRTNHMTAENRLQTTVWLTNIYRRLLEHVSIARHIDTSLLASYADSLSVRTPADALNFKFVDGLKYDDEVKDEIKKKLGLTTTDKTNFISINKYARAASFRESGDETIALIYAEGDIVDGRSDQPRIIASETYVNMIRKARLDPSVKAIVFRVNSGGGSSLASENIWRELSVTRRSKPVVVSFGDVAASGGYYISCEADSIFADATTITGSIGVFGIIPNLQNFFKNKIGVTFDGVKTAQNADAGFFRPLNEMQKHVLQNSIELTYRQFKQRVADGRKRDTAYVESIAQGRVWTADDGLRLGLVDRLGGLQQAVACAAKLAKTASYHLREYPEPENILQRLLHSPGNFSKEMEKTVGPETYQVMQQAAKVRDMTTGIQARLPFSFIVR